MVAGTDALLRGEGEYAAGQARLPWPGLAMFVVLGGAVYGACMGSFAMRPLQSFYSACKVPLLLGLTTAVCLPSFFVLNTILGLRSDFRAACRGVLASQATVAVGLASLAPVAMVGYASSSDYRLAIVLNGVCFLAAALAGQCTLARHYTPLLSAEPKHHAPRALWGVLYVFVAVQLAWVLRPFVGDPALAPHFFREEAWSNAYVVVTRTVVELLGSMLPH